MMMAVAYCYVMENKKFAWQQRGSTFVVSTARRCRTLLREAVSAGCECAPAGAVCLPFRRRTT